MSIRPRPNISTLESTLHGGPNQAELEAIGLDPSTMIDFSSNCNPYGPPQQVLEVLKAISDNVKLIARYPDTQCLDLRRDLAHQLNLMPEQVVVGNGASEMIWCLALAYLQAGDTSMVVTPAYGEYAAASRIAGAYIHEVRAPESEGFRPDIEQLCTTIRAERPRLVWICTPNNPVGYYLQSGEVEQLLHTCITIGALLILDEAYISFVDNAWNALPMLHSGHLVLLRSMTKDYAIAGLRLGYLLASPDIAATIRKVLPPWSVNAFAQAAGKAALTTSEAFMRDSRRALISDMIYLTGGLRKLRLYPLPTHTNFYILDVGDATALRTELLKHGLLVRNCTSFGMPRHIRLAIRPQQETRTLLEALALVRSTFATTQSV